MNFKIELLDEIILDKDIDIEKILQSIQNIENKDEKSVDGETGEDKL